MDSCERCKGPIERTDDDRFVCPRCGIWVHLDGAELGPPITEEQAQSNLERWTIETAAAMVEAAKGVDQARLTSYDGFQMEQIETS